MGRFALICALCIWGFLSLFKWANGDTYLGCDPPEQGICSTEYPEIVPEIAEIEVEIDGEPRKIKTYKGTPEEKLFYTIEDSDGNPFYALLNMTKEGLWPLSAAAEKTIRFRGSWACEFDEGDEAWSGWTEWYTPSPEKAFVTVEIEVTPEPPDPPPEPEAWMSGDDFTAVRGLGASSGAIGFSMIVRAHESPIDGIIMYLDSSVDLIPFDQGGWQYDKAAMLVQLSDDGFFRVSDDLEYRAETLIAYGTEDHILQVTTDPGKQTYSVLVDGVEIATDYKYHSRAPASDDIGQVCIQSYPQGTAGNFEVRNHRVMMP